MIPIVLSALLSTLLLSTLLFLEAALPGVAGAQDTKALTMNEAKDMESHPDAALLDNLQKKNYAAISDARWSRWNQWTVLLGYSLCLKDEPDASAKVGKDDLQTLGNAFSGGLVTGSPWPYGVSYFLKEHVSLLDNGQDRIFLSAASPSATEMATKVAASVRTHGGCGSSYNTAVLKGFAALYRQRTKADADRTSIPDAPDSQQNVLQFLDGVMRDRSIINYLSSQEREDYFGITYALYRSSAAHDYEQQKLGMEKFDVFISKLHAANPRSSDIDTLVWDGGHLKELIAAAKKP